MRLRRGFTLIELLVVVVIVGVLATLVVTAFHSAVDSARVAACSANLRQIGGGIGAYAADNDGRIPYGPKAGMMRSAGTLYPSTGAPTSLISLASGEPVALGLILKYLRDPKVLFCPGADEKIDVQKELAKVGHEQAQSSYFYRHGGNTALRDGPNTSDDPPNIRLGNLGENRNGKPIRALVIDAIMLAPKELGSFNVKTRTNHRRKYANILFVDGHVATIPNEDGKFTVDARQGANLYNAFSLILGTLEAADEGL